LAAELGEAHPTVGVEVLPADLARRDDLEAVAARVAATDHPIDLLVNNAGFGTYGDLAELDVETELEEIAVNVTAVVRLTHAAVPAMTARGTGAILNVSSVAGLQATPGNATYGATKALLASLGEPVAGELGGNSDTLAAARAGRPWCVPGVLNKVLVAAAGPVPRGLKRRIAARVARRV